MKKIEDISLVIYARLNSQRCPNKMVRPFANSTLLDIGIKKVLSSKIIPKKNIYIGVYEKKLIDIAKKYNFEVIKSDDIVSDLYSDESIKHEINKYLDIKHCQDNLEATVKKLFFTSKKNKEIIEAIFHPIVHKIINDSLDINQNLMVELPPIISNYELFQRHKSIYIQKLYLDIDIVVAYVYLIFVHVDLLFKHLMTYCLIVF